MYYGHGYGYGKTKKAGAGFDPVAAAYFAAVPNAFSAARKTIINTLIAGLRSDGNLTKLDRLWLFANTTTGNAVIDVVNLQSITLVNAPGFVADQGYTGNGTTSYIDTNYNPSTNGVNVTQNSNSLGLYVRTHVNEARYDMGASIVSRYEIISSYNSSAAYNGNFNTTEGTYAQADARGLSHSQRTASNLTTMYMNGVSKGTHAEASLAPPNNNVYVCATNNGGTPIGLSTKQMSIVFFGSGAINQANMYTRIQNYMTALGTQV